MKAPSIEVEVKAPKTPSVECEVDVECEVEVKAPCIEVEVKAPSIEVDVKAPSIEVEVKAPKMPSMECEVEIECEVEVKAPSIEVEVAASKAASVDREIGGLAVEVSGVGVEDVVQEEERPRDVSPAHERGSGWRDRLRTSVDEAVLRTEDRSMTAVAAKAGSLSPRSSSAAPSPSANQSTEGVESLGIEVEAPRGRTA